MWRRLFGRAKLREDLDEEIRAHVAMAVRARVERGESPDEAERCVRREFGNELLIKDVARDMWGWGWLDRMSRDFKYALRQMMRDPAFTVITVLTLALGVGATTTMFSVVNSVLLEPMKYRDPGQLYLVSMTPPMGLGSIGNWPVNARHFEEWRSRCRTCEQVAIAEGDSFGLTGVGEPDRLPGLRVSYNFFRALGVEPALGRDFLPEEESHGEMGRVLIADSLWRSHFASDPGIVGRTIQVEGRTVTVLGVMPPSLSLPVGNQWGVLFSNAVPPVIFQPVGMDLAAQSPDSEFRYASIVRVKPGATAAQASAEMTALLSEFSRTSKLNLRPILTPMQDGVTRGARSGLWLLLGAVAAVLLIVCVNTGNLMLVRTASRETESAIRLALGASRGDVFALVFKEAALLAGLGAALGILAARTALKALVATAPSSLPRIGEVHMDGKVLLFAAAAAVFSMLACGLAPAWRLAWPERRAIVRQAAARTTADRRKLRFRDLMVGAEVAISTLLLIVGGLLTLSFVRLIRVEKGFDMAHVITQDVSLLDGHNSSAQSTVFVDEAIRRLEAIPGVDSAGVVSRMPLRGEGWIDRLEDAALPHDQSMQSPLANFRFASPDYQKAMAIPLKQGRFFDDSDRNRKVVVLSERSALALWPGVNPIGKRVRLTDQDDTAGEVIGVVGEVRAAIEQEAPLTVYEPHWEQNKGGVAFVIRTRADAAALIGSIRAALRSLDSRLPLARTKTMEQILDDSVAVRRFQLYLAAAFAAAALALASLGIYGVVSFTVAKRTSELGIRIALGAPAAQLMRMVLRQGMLPVIAGLAAGVGAALAIGGLLASQLYRVTPHDPATIAGVTAVLLAVAMCACWIPARRAARVDALRALRVE